MQNKDFMHLHLHSTYSILDGIGTPDQYAQRAAEMGFKSLAISDHGNIDGAIKWQKACKAKNIKSILGCEFYIVPEILYRSKNKKEREKCYHLTILAKNEIGWQNILKMLTCANIQGFYYRPRIDPFILQDHLDGLIILSGCASSPIQTKWGQELFKKIQEKTNFYLEVMPHAFKEQIEINALCIEWQKQFPKVKLCATNDIHYVEKDQSKIQEVLLAIQSKAKWNDPDRWKFNIDGLHLRSANEMFQAFLNQQFFNDFTIQEVMENSLEVASLCNFELNKISISLPKIEILKYKNMSEENQLINLCLDGLEKKRLTHTYIYDNINKYYERLEEELNIIINQGFARYFLIVWDLIDWCHKNDIMTGPRGSSVGSLVVYLLDITMIDPIKYNLMFARFISPDRIDLPDIDIDFEDIKRDRIKKRLEELYGQYNVSGISTFSKMQGKQSIRNISRVFDIPLSEVNVLSNSLNYKIDEETEIKNTLTELFKNTNDAKIFYNKYPEICNIAISLEGQCNNTSQHASAVCISSKDLRSGINTNIVRKKGDSLCCNWDKEDAEYMGLMKLDVLGSSALTILNYAKKIIKKNYDIDIIYSEINTNDTEVLNQFTIGNTAGIVQFYGHGITTLCKDVKIDNLKSLIDVNALFRPGTLRSGLTDLYKNRKSGAEKIPILNKVVENITKNTYGIPLYQEQVMQLFVNVAGFSWSDADKIRKIIGKSKGVKEFDKFKKAFINGCVFKKTLNILQAEILFNDLKHFSEYSFNLSHATAYSIIAYWEMWLKVYYPKEFIISSLNFAGENQKNELIKEARRLNLEIELPDINISDGEKWILKDDKLIAPFSEIKGMGLIAANSIIAERKNGNFINNYDFLRRINKQKVNVRIISLLEKINALPNKKEKIDFIEVSKILNFDYSCIGKISANIAIVIIDNQIKKIMELNKIISNCSLCDLRKEATQPVLSSIGQFNIMINAEAPNKQEDKSKSGLTGQAGLEILWPELLKYEIKRENVYVSNCIKCWPQFTKTPTEEQIDICSQYLKKEIKIVNPFIILAFGNSNNYFFNRKIKGILALNGTTVWSKEYNCFICFCIHPSSCFYSPENKELFSIAIRNFAYKVNEIGFGL
jgi:DNA polymerase-3 subunit alpha